MVIKIELTTKDFSKVKGTYFCFTDFKNSFVDMAKIYYNNKDLIRYLYVGKEICPKTKKLHLQGYVQMFSQCRATAIQKMFNVKFHINKCNGSVEQNIDYCGKDGDTREWGVVSKGQGFRSDLHNIKDDLLKGDSMYEIMNNYTSQFVRYHSGIGKMKELIDYKLRCKDRPNLKVTAIYGKAGSGKTTYVYDKHGYEDVYVLNETNYKKGFWNNYKDQKTLLIDEFHGWIKYKDLLQITDRHPYPVNLKNGSTMANWDNVYIISNRKPASWYTNIADNLKRRVHKCLEVTEGNTKDLCHPWMKDPAECVMYDTDED